MKRSSLIRAAFFVFRKVCKLKTKHVRTYLLRSRTCFFLRILCVYLHVQNSSHGHKINLEAGTISD